MPKHTPKCPGFTVSGAPCSQPLPKGAKTCGQCKGTNAQALSSDAGSMSLDPSDPFADMPPDPFASAGDDGGISSEDQLDAALVDYGHAHAADITSLRKARWEARKRIVEAAQRSLSQLEGEKGVSKPERIERLRASSREFLQIAAFLEAAAQHDAQRDENAWDAKKMGSGGIPSLSGDDEFVPLDQDSLKDDMAGWAAKHAAGDDFDEQLQSFLDEEGGNGEKDGPDAPF